MRYLFWLWHNTKGIRQNILLRISAGTIRVAAGLLLVWLCRRFVDVTIRTGTAVDILQMVVAMVATVLVGVLLRQLYFYMGQRAMARQGTTIRSRIFCNLFRQEMSESHQFHSGDVASRLQKDIDIVSDATANILSDFIVVFIQLVGAFMLMRTMDARLAWVLLLLTPFFVVGGKVLARRMRDMTLIVREQESKVQMLVQESMEHQEVLRSLNSSGWIVNCLDDMQKSLCHSIYSRARFTVISRLLIAGIFSLGYIIAFIWGGLQLREGAISFGVMTSFLQLVSQIQQPILQMFNLLPLLFHATASIDRLEELYSFPEEGACKGRTVLSQSYSICFDNVSFRYADDEHYIIHNFTHTFMSGSKTAIMGETGAGKTTLFRLLLGFVQPTNGTIETGELTFVPQGNTLLSGTIHFNLQLAKPDVTTEEMRHALHTACADFVWALPNGIETLLGERGARLSEGQAQRIAIARGLLHQGEIMLLDEISSALDEQTEAELFRRIFLTFPDKTILLITHRTAVAKLCDEIIRVS